MCQTSNVEKEYKEHMIDDSSNLLSNTKCNYIDCNFKSLVTIKCGDISCNNWSHHICQNEYDCAIYMIIHLTPCIVAKNFVEYVLTKLWKTLQKVL